MVHRPAATGDGTGIVGGTDGTSPFRNAGHLRWTVYDHREGRARGTVWLDDCEPSCADGTFAPLPVRVHVFAPKDGRFTRLTLQFTYHGKQVTDRRGIRDYGSSWEYYIISTNARATA